MSATPIVIGISGFKRNAAVALGRQGQLVALCEEGRVTRARNVGVRDGGFPSAALEEVRTAASVDAGDIGEVVVAEPDLRALAPAQARQLDHHHAHAAAAFLTSPFPDATILVCDTDEAHEVSVWRGQGTDVTPVECAWQGPGFARVYSQLTALLGLRGGWDEHLVERLAGLQLDSVDETTDDWLAYTGNGLRLAPGFAERVAEAATQRDLTRMALVAASIQRRLAETLVEFLRDVATQGSSTNLCVGGGLFFNTYVNTVLRQAGVFGDVYVPVNPGSAGVAAGCALARACELSGRAGETARVSPFLGPAYTNGEIKAVLDNCKLSYAFLPETKLIERAVHALQHGQLVGWFSGRLEWGARALGNRSIFANPFAPHVLENLNGFLKHRAVHHPYALVVTEDEVGKFFDGPDRSPYMEYEYRYADLDRFAAIRPAGVTRARLQTVGGEPRHLRQLLTTFGQAAGIPVLVNTSFNGFQEPIVCSPRDAVRVFYGTGLDMLVVGNFVVTK